MISELVCAIIATGVICLVIAVADGISSLAYRIPWVKRRVDKFIENLPEWAQE